MFQSELLKSVLLIRMGHELKIDLKDETPDINRPFYDISPLKLADRQK